MQKALAEDKSDAIVLGCAGMSDLCLKLQNELGVIVIDGVAAAVKQAEMLVQLNLKPAKLVIGITSCKELHRHIVKFWSTLKIYCFNSSSKLRVGIETKNNQKN